MPAKLADILAQLDRVLEPRRFADYCPNGLQVPGPADVRVLATCVSAHMELFERARDAEADLIVAHHGIFWGSRQQGIDAAMKARLALLFEADIGLAAYHLPLDAHAQLGNNALIGRALGAARLEPFASHGERTIGFLAIFDGEGIAASDLLARVRELTSREPLVFDSGPPRIRRLAIVSGAGASYLDEAASAGADAFLTGEPAERVMAHAREQHLHFIAAGHYATETFGVKRVGDYLAEHFDVRHVFIDVPNPV